LKIAPFSIYIFNGFSVLFRLIPSSCEISASRQKWKKIWCASRTHVNFPHIANKQFFTFHIFFIKIQSELLEILKKEKALKTLLKSSFMQNFNHSTHFWHSLKKIAILLFKETLKRLSKNSKLEYDISNSN
jgi:hypothetical protein